MKDRIECLLRAGKSYSEIRQETGCSKSTVAYHAKRLGLSPPRSKYNRERVYDWKEISAYYDAGHSMRECAIRFGCSRGALWGAVKRGDLTSRDRATPIASFLVEDFDGSRNNIKRRLLRDKVLKNKCYKCGQGPKWKGQRLVLVLDHINGKKNDYRLTNLRILCPNCNSQTETFSGRNKGKSDPG